MPIYNAQIVKIDVNETRRYAGLSRDENFSEQSIVDACDEAALLLQVRGVWKLYDYDAENFLVKSTPKFKLDGKSITRHLADCEKVICMAVTVGEEIEREVTRRFSAGNYVESVLLDAAATAAVEQAADSLERAISPQFVKEGFKFKSRFSPGYGDWDLSNQKNFFNITGAAEIGIGLSSALMLIPRKSVTAIIGLEKNKSDAVKNSVTKCSKCNQLDCLARR